MCPPGCSVYPGSWPARPGRKQPRFADFHHGKFFFAHALRQARLRQIHGWLVQRFVGQIECAPVQADAAPGAEDLVNLHGFRRIDVLLFHEPARLVSAHRDQRKVKSAGVTSGEALAGV